MIPGWLISIITFPGVMLHEWAHEQFCRWMKVPIHRVVYFRFGNPAGYVLHEQPHSYKQVFWVSTGPLIVNSIGTILISFIASQSNADSWLYLILLWLAISFGMHSFPSDHDMEHISAASKNALQNRGSVGHYFAFPFVALVWLSNKLRVFWFDAIYAILLISLSGGFQ